MERSDTLLKKLQAMQEDDLSRDILLPLLRKLGFSRVEFFGGPYEAGKDIIAHTTDPLGTPQITVFQVKKFQSARNFEKRSQWQQLVYQLRQAGTQPIANLDGRRMIPQKVVLLTPFPVDTKLIEEQLGLLKIESVDIIDAPRLLQLIDSRWPSLYEELLGTQVVLPQLTATEDRASELHRALDVDSTADVSDYYCDLNFYLGNIDSKQLLASRAYVAQTALEIHVDQWGTVESALRRLEKVAGIAFCAKSFAELNKTFRTLHERYTSEANQRRINNLQTRSKQLSMLGEQLSQETGSMIRWIRDPQQADVDPTGDRERQERVDHAKRRRSMSVHEERLYIAAMPLYEIDWNDHKGFSAERIAEILDAISIQCDSLTASPQGRTLGKKIQEYLDKLPEMIREFSERRESALRLERDTLINPMTAVDFDTDRLVDYINSKIDRLAIDLRSLNDAALSLPELTDLLREAKRLLFFSHTVKSTSLSQLIRWEKNSSEDHRLEISAHRIFDCRIDVTVHGDAGAGKSTTLHTYAQRLYTSQEKGALVLFFPLNRVLTAAFDRGFPIAESAKREGASHALLSCFLIYREIDPSAGHLSELYSMVEKSDKVVLLFDGLDEVSNFGHWVKEGIKEIKQRFRKSQVVVSTRDTTSSIADLGFLGITLLPFTPDQLRRFILGWSTDTRRGRQLWEQLKGRQLFEVAKNPLLATVVCSLHDNGVALPENEAEVYRKKVELLCGQYDRYKGITRLKTPQNVLQVACRKLAFALHEVERRDISLDEATAIFHSQQEGRLTIALAKQAVAELVDPCTILQRSPVSDRFAFEHLRIQEFLVAEEMSRNRGIDIVPLLSKSWWRGALYLYAIDNDFDELIEECFHRCGSIRRAYLTLSAMADAKSASRKAQLVALLDKYIEQDIFESSVIGEIGDADYFYGNSMESEVVEEFCFLDDINRVTD